MEGDNRIGIRFWEIQKLIGASRQSIPSSPESEMSSHNMKAFLVNCRFVRGPYAIFGQRPIWHWLLRLAKPSIGGQSKDMPDLS